MNLYFLIYRYTDRKMLYHQIITKLTNSARNFQIKINTLDRLSKGTTMSVHYH